MSTQYLKQLEREITAKLERYKADLDWLTADSANSYPKSNTSQTTQDKAAKSSVKLPLPTHKKESLLNLSPEEFKERYEREGGKFAEAFYAELARKSEAPQPTQQQQPQFTFINAPPKYSSEEIMKRIKDGESLEKILNDHKE
ncbi:hypothetical protein [Anabaena sp. CCY 9910]|uniref:hypothetical protein n=1 Tax=Anabaena sp. CCY 9910 TaxID=3103870 RepID=UPI0039E12064